ncbi:MULTISPECIES: hypothetical protein [Erysipelotrichaceae]|uniref:Uncharacterized protein n=1 Tax=[Eubacterium] hominis TaxID=2764325 RepID=A0A7G9GNM9_9FIRM|nr:hypothetical protein [Absiella sp. AM27-20]QNM12411.1 hypothetical protein H9Q80_00195 [[Eubacterium] hominis]RHU10656.1 hypothetical protein DW716_01155 [Absiella sp. AM27-20]
MPIYVKNGRRIFASVRAYDALYKEQGYLPEEAKQSAEPTVINDKATMAELEAPTLPDTKQDPQDLDDFSDEDDAPVNIDDNAAMPLAARVGLLPYNDLKQKAKELGIPKYANTKHEDLVNLVVEALEAQGGN